MMWHTILLLQLQIHWILKHACWLVYNHSKHGITPWHNSFFFLTNIIIFIAKNGSIFYFFLHRYDLLCLEGLAQALRVFCEFQEIPTYKLSKISKDAMLKMHVKPEVLMPCLCFFLVWVFAKWKMTCFFSLESL